jgi:hypothetical protein
MINSRLLMVLLAVSGLFFPDSSGARNDIHQVDMTEKHSRLTADLQSLVGKSDSYAEIDSKPLVKIEQVIHSSLKHDFSIISLKIKYSNYSNSYCRLAINESERMNLIHLPKTADFDNCKGVSSAKFHSFDGKNEAIIILSTLVPSNRYADMATVQQVYVLSSSKGYCYSSRASEAVNAFGTHSRLEPDRLIKSESLRRGIDLMVCAD